MRKEVEYANYRAELYKAPSSEVVSPPVGRQTRFDKPETSSVSTTFTVAPSVSSSSSSALSSAAPLSPVRLDSDVKSPRSAHDSTISRLIDAVSLDNEQDTCGSISALISQFENTLDPNHFPLPHESTPSRHSNCRAATPKVEESRSPFGSDAPSPFEKLLSPQRVAQISKRLNRGMCSPRTNAPADACSPALTSSPETAELEEVYTILDEMVLLPVSVYNLKKRAVHVQADTTESKPSGSFGFSPTKAVRGVGNAHGPGWDGADGKPDEARESEEPEERVYEEVNDLYPTVPETTPRPSQGRASVNGRYQFRPDSTRDTFAEVEMNVDEDPLERTLASPARGGRREELTSPTKRHAIYQNHEYPQQRQPALYRSPRQEHASHFPRAAFPDARSPVGQTSGQLSTRRPNPPPPHRRPINSRPSNQSALRQNSYPTPHCTSGGRGHSGDSSSSYKLPRGFSGPQVLNKTLQEKTACQQTQTDQAGPSHNGLPSSESQAAVSRDRNLYSPRSESDAVYSHPEYGRMASSPPCPVSQNNQPHGQTQSQAPNETRRPKLPHVGSRHQTRAESDASVRSPSASPPKPSPSATAASRNHSPCKSKSLGDLTSEDISCNFQSKYHIISRSFITPHMRRHRRTGAVAGEALQSPSCDPLTEQLRKLVSLEGDDGDRDADRPRPPQLHRRPPSHPQTPSVAPPVPADGDDSPPPLTRRLSSRSQSRVRHINIRARERQQEAQKPRAGVVISSAGSIGGVVLRNKPASQNPPANRHSTGSYIAGYFGQLEDRGLPEGACTSLLHGNKDRYGDRHHADDALQSPSQAASEPEVYFLLRL